MSTVSMSTKLRIAQIRHRFEEYNKRNLAVLDAECAPDVVVHNVATGAEIRGIEAYKQSWNGTFTAFPDVHYTVEDVVVEGDKVALRYTMTGTHEGRLGNIAANLAPTGKKVTQTLFGLQRYEGGKIAEIWSMSNRLSFYQQLGVTPTPEMK
jgi:predicted ester cyclase